MPPGRRPPSKRWRTVASRWHVDPRRKPRLACPLFGDHPQLRRPVRQRQAQPFHVRMAGARICASTAAISRRQRASHAFRRPSMTSSNLLPSPSSLVLTTQRLPPLYYDIHVLRIEFDTAAACPRSVPRGESGAAAQERLVHQLAPLGLVQDRAPRQLDRLLRRMVEFLLVRAAHDELQ